MKIFDLIEWSYDGNSHSLWSHTDKQQGEFEKDCKWLLNTHLDLILVDKVEPDGEVWHERIGSEECIKLIEEYLPKLGYEKVETENFIIEWTNLMENTKQELFTEDTIQEIKRHNENN